MRVLITGARGFVGTALLAAWQGREVQLIAHTTNSNCLPGTANGSGVKWVCIQPHEQEHWHQVLTEVDVVIHLAARVHVMSDRAADSQEKYRETNVARTEALAAMAAQAGVRRFVYVSSVKVNGEATGNGLRFDETSPPQPQDSYGASKWEAEQALHKISAQTGMEVVIIRPPLVYGAGVKGNFAQMLSVIVKGIPLPLASVTNRRSLIYVGNLADALIACAEHPEAAGQTYLVSDGNGISTSQLIRQLASEMGVKAHLFPCPPALLRLAGLVVGKSQQVARLLGSLEVDSDKIRRDLNWVPPYSLQQGLRMTAEWYRNQNQS